MTSLLLVEWLGRGGIAQVTDTWRTIAAESGATVTVVGRAQGEIPVDVCVKKRLPGLAGGLEVHVRAVRAARKAILELRPDVVVLQNYQLPLSELALVRVARSVGARTVLAAHNAAPHERFASSGLGLRRLVREVDTVMVHSRHVGREMQDRYGRAAVVVPLPIHRAVTETRPEPFTLPRLDAGARWVASFGVLTRGYKGVQTVRAIADRLPPGWKMAVAGRGAEAAGPNCFVVDRFLSPGELRWFVEESTAVVLPYRSASQSGAVLMSQALGAVPIASSVGGIPEQIEDGRTGVLIAPGAPVDAWIVALEASDDPSDRWSAMASAARSAALFQDQEARRMFLELLH